MSRSRRRIASLIAALLLVLSGGVGAMAAPDPNFDDSAYSSTQKAEAEATAQDAAAEQFCSFVSFLGSGCKNAVKATFTAASIAELGADTVCGKLGVFAGPGCNLIVDMDVTATAFNLAYQTALLGMEIATDTAQGAVDVVENVAGMTAFFVDPQGAFERFVNSLKEDTVKLLSDVITNATEGNSFDATAQWWRDTYAAAAGIGIAVLAFMLLLSGWQASAGKISGEDFAIALVKYAPFAVLMMFMGPPVAWGLSWVTSELTEALVQWQQEPLQKFVDGSLYFGMASAEYSGVLASLVLFLLLGMVCFGLLITMAVQTVSLYIIGAVIAIAWGMFVNPRWRRKALAVVMVWLGILLSKPALILVLGIVLQLTGPLLTEPDPDAPFMEFLTTGFFIIVALGIVAFSPWALLKFFPLLPEGSDSTAASPAGGVSSAMAGAAGSAAMQIGMRRASQQTGSRANASGSTQSGAVSGGGNAGGGGIPKSAPTNVKASSSAGGSSKGRMAGVLSRSKTAKGAGPVAAKGAGQVATKSGAGAAAKGAASKIGGAIGGAATGGALFAASIASSASQAGIQRAREASAAAIPEITERAGETS